MNSRFQQDRACQLTNAPPTLARMYRSRLLSLAILQVGRRVLFVLIVILAALADPESQFIGLGYAQTLTPQRTATSDYSFPIPPRPTSSVTDSAGLLSPSVLQTLRQELSILETESTIQVLVYIDHRIPPGPSLQQYSLACFNTWNIGKPNRDNAIAIFTFSEHRKVHIQVGTDLQGVLPNKVSRHILQRKILLNLRQANYDAGILAGVHSIVQTLTGANTAPPVSGTGPTPWADYMALGISTFFFMAGLLGWVTVVAKPHRSHSQVYPLARGTFLFAANAAAFLFWRSRLIPLADALESAVQATPDAPPLGPVLQMPCMGGRHRSQRHRDPEIVEDDLLARCPAKT